MRSGKLLRYVRIVFSAFCGLACVLLLVLWVRSDAAWIYFPAPNGKIGMESNQGALALVYKTYSPPRVVNGFSLSNYQREWSISVRYSLVIPIVGLLGLCAALPSIAKPKQFSLRTLLIATTLVAVVLGIIVYDTR